MSSESMSNISSMSTSTASAYLLQQIKRKAHNQLQSEFALNEMDSTNYLAE